MSEEEDAPRDLGALVVMPVGSVVETGDLWEPYQILGPAGEPVAAVVAYLGELQAAGRSASTQRSYALALLRWFRFLWAIDVDWRRATRVEARDFARWIQIAPKPVRRQRRSPDEPRAAISNTATVADTMASKCRDGRGYASATIAHSETVARSFYAYHLEAGTGPLMNPFPLARLGRAHAHHNPMERFGPQRAGRYRPRQVKRVPRQIPDEVFNELFARLRSDRDRALVAFWVSTGARASELLGVQYSGADLGQQLITVVRKGSREDRTMVPAVSSPVRLSRTAPAADHLVHGRFR